MQSSQVDDADAERARQSMRQTRKYLHQREQELIREREAILAEVEDLTRFVGAQTLRGSRANAYSRRVEALNERKIQYQKDKELLENDYRLYEASLQKMIQGIVHGTGVPAASAPDEMEKLKAGIEDQRKRLVEEYRTLKKEKAGISAGNATQSDGPTVAEQMAEWNARRNDHAQARRFFNDAVNSFNTTTGQNLPTLPPL